MKRIFCVLLVLIMCLGLCACGTQTKNEYGAKVDGLGPYVYICDIHGEFDSVNGSHWLGYHRDTLVVYECYLPGTNYGIVHPYQIYENGAIYGAVYENGEIVPVPYALGVTEEMIENQFNSWFG